MKVSKNLLFLLGLTACPQARVVESCPDDGFSASGSVVLAGESRTASAEVIWLETDADGTCLTSVQTTLDFGQGCTLQVQADGSASPLTVFEANFFGEENCSMSGNVDFDDPSSATVIVDGELEQSATGTDTFDCFVGGLQFVFDSALSSNDGTWSIDGTLEFDGKRLTTVTNATCE